MLFWENIRFQEGQEEEMLCWWGYTVTSEADGVAVSRSTPTKPDFFFFFKCEHVHVKGLWQPDQNIPINSPLTITAPFMTLLLQRYKEEEKM